MGRVRYNRGNIQDCITKASQLKTHCFVVATGYGFTITKIQPPSNQRYCEFNSKGQMHYHEPTFIADIVGNLTSSE